MFPTVIIGSGLAFILYAVYNYKTTGIAGNADGIYQTMLDTRLRPTALPRVTNNGTMLALTSELVTE